MVTLRVDIYKPTATSDPGFNYNIIPHISAYGQITSGVRNKFILPYWRFRSGCTIPGQNCLRLALKASGTKYCSKLASGRFKARRKLKSCLNQFSQPIIPNSGICHVTWDQNEIKFWSLWDLLAHKVRLLSLQGESDPGSRKTCGTRVLSAHRGGAAPVGSGEEPGR